MSDADRLGVETHGLCVKLQGTPVLEGIDLHLARGTFCGIVGPNGAGKTTLLRTLTGLQAHHAGTVRVLGHAPGAARARHAIAYVPQNASQVDARFPATAREVVRIGRLGRRALWKPPNRGDEDQVRQAMEEVGVWDLRDRSIGRLSGGQRQRVFLAKAMAQEPLLLLLDEPTTGVDQEARANFYGLLRHVHRDHGLTIVMVSHEASHLRLLADRLVAIERRKRFDGTPAEFDAYDASAHLHDIPHGKGEGIHA